MFTKLEKLKNWFEDKERVALAFSGGVDSALLLKVGEMTLGSGLSAITIHSPLNKEEELKVAQRLAENLKVEQIVVNLNDLEIAEVASNHSERCYYCKKNRFEKLISLIKEKNIKWIIEGSNLDDLKDYRPGLRAVKELGIRSPLQEIGFTKKEIRNLARYLDVPVWNKPSEPCLATRFPVGTNLNLDNLKRIEQCEEYVKRLLDIKILRIRDYNNLARIEVLEEDIKLLLQNKVEITRELKKKGFKYITLDLNGYKQGSMNNTGGS
ncbi:ATP-dependent sacrificial sulfur transferase LarE [Desulfonispora thiosulfatigenes]|uniref:ATP-dependent sacrificial sulfur transferase LarE n=1 Tax=Desulfonispora thiosulfatigenes TaxID=83661 RepID=UPI001177F14A|nr:ATP-dependent sacrificial sulfur transferase LarE [Desulfonispora thiosulfatigenes]